MAEFTLSQVVEATAGTSAHTDNIKFLDVSTDTRTIESGFLFVALKGDTFDGHDFINTAIEKGATGAIVEKGRAVEGIVCIEVENTLVAYQNLARYHRRRFDIPVVAITGSSGKTTTKEMVAAVLGTEFNVLKTEKNFNNEIGLPKTLLRLTAEHEACVVEMGMRGLGQIEELALIAEPTMGIITNVGTSHIELLGSREAIAEAKGELIRCLPENSVAILNEDDPYVKAMDSLAKGKTITYGIERLAMYIQKVDSVYDIEWVDGVTYGDVHHQNEVDYSHYNFEVADTEMLFSLFDQFENECYRVVKLGYPQPAYDYCLKCSHTFNLLDARSAISVTERQSFIGRVRNMARECAAAYLQQREQLGFPLLKDQALREKLGLEGTSND